MAGLPTSGIAPEKLSGLVIHLAFYADWPVAICSVLKMHALVADLCLRDGLAPRGRNLLTVAALLAMGQADQIGYYLGRAMEARLTPA
ncbi:hypothetical protein BFP70_19580 [Thioclava sp. SK-1]|uniref:carboxymuconolactone decarboxylase family protein n=1 Tax=Thioclava sp. SK-1 TaxID=1889770 RepID=UPI000826EB99|nr:carboxymuconolactone decarboxylase family protein [Thioclava sp. SK-1]OCX56618.1 hypothetical protein BFP70_19580 [Thioclava sp. SK-1]